MSDSSVKLNSERFIARWKESGASERANYQVFLIELCDLLGVEKPRPASDRVHEATYTFERPVIFDDGEGRVVTNYIDLYKQHCFVLEAKQGSDKVELTEAELLGADKAKTKIGTAKRDTRSWDREMKKAKEQALRYARSLPSTDGWPPFLVVVDVGFCIDLYSDFARQGKTYIPFPGPLNYRISLLELEKDDIQERLRLLFTNPQELDPSRRAEKVTRELAGRLAKLAALLEQAGHSAEKVAGFLMRCLFTMFAEDVQLLPERSFTKLLLDYKERLDLLPKALESLWISMDKGGFDPALRTLIPQFNGFLFKDQEALPLTEAQADLLILASEADWANVEPAIFGTLLERALQPRERHKLGAHYTPRAYVERLVMPTVIEPLREEWEAARTASAILESKDDDNGALREINEFHRRLCSIRILDPACGSGNFLYVTLEHLKRLEGEVNEYMARFPRQLGLDMTGGYTVTPAQFLGLEINPRAAAIADVVLWIGYLQWHFRTHGHANRLEDPILRQYGNIKLQDAVLNYSHKELRLNTKGEPMSRWDGHSTIRHFVTGLEVPDESAQTPVYDYIDPKPTVWPEADFIVGNPPFIGNKKMRITLGDGYTEALRAAYTKVPESADFVVYWWYKAAEIIRSNNARRFGFITTSRITQPFNRIVIEAALNNDPPIKLIYAIPDHPWVDSNEGASVRIAITVAGKDADFPAISKVVEPANTDDYSDVVQLTHYQGVIHADLSVGVNLTAALPLQSNYGVSYWGVKFYGKGFILSEYERLKFQKTLSREIIKPFISGRDLTQLPRNLHVIDSDELGEAEIRLKYPDAYQHLLMNVKPERDHNPREKRKVQWWSYGENQPGMRRAVMDIKRYIATGEVLKHRNFQFYDTNVLAEGKVCVIALDDAYFLGILSSKYHTTWAAATGGRLGVGNDLVYVKTKCFDTFPFPDATEVQKQRVRNIAERLDQHRKDRRAHYPALTITELYNVMVKLQSGQSLDKAEQKSHEEGLVSVLLQLHNELDSAVADAYGWSGSLSELELFKNLFQLNKERAFEEARGLIRWLRPEYQNPNSQVQQTGLNLMGNESDLIYLPNELFEWPKTLAGQAQAVQRIILLNQHPVAASDICKLFKKTTNIARRARERQIEELLETISTLGLLRKTKDGLFTK